MADSNVALWQGRCHAKSSVVITILCITLVAIMFGFFLAMHFLKFGAVAIVLIVLFVLDFVAIMLVGGKLRWNNPHLIFSLTDEALFFTSDKNSESYFYEGYNNIDRCTYKNHQNGYVTAQIWFKQPASAGMYGKLKSLTMAQVENKEQLLAVLQAHGVPCEEITDKK